MAGNNAEKLLGNHIDSSSASVTDNHQCIFSLGPNIDIFTRPNCFQDKFLEKYSDDYDIKGGNNERRIANQIETGLSKGEKLYKMSQLVGLKGNKSVNDQLPQRLLFSKRCYSDANHPNDDTYHADILHGFTLKDPMCFKVKVGKTENQVGCLRMILKGFIYYTAKEETSERKLNKKRKKKKHHIGALHNIYLSK